MSTQFWNGNMAAAQAARRARVQLVAAYPITPQTHTVEYLSQFVADGELAARMIKVESEHSALSACCGAAAVGARTFTASCSQGLQLMSEVMYFASGMRFPIVMAIANRTLSAPVNIWPDHQDTLVNRDSGWLQFYATNVQEIYDLTLCAFRVAEREEISLPALVAYDGFILSHANEPVEEITQAQADAFLPQAGITDRPILDPEQPVQFGEVLFPEWYPDYEYKKHEAVKASLPVFEDALAELGRITGRHYDSVETDECAGADVVLLGLGSMMQTAQIAARELRAKGQRVGILTLRSFRPFPEAALREALRGVSTLIVLDRDVGYGTSGMVYPDVTRALYHADARPRALNCVIGLGGKDITPQTIRRCVEIAGEDHGDQTVFWPDARGPREGIPWSGESKAPAGAGR